MRKLAPALILALVSTHCAAAEAPTIGDHFAIDTNTAPWVYIPIPELDQRIPLKPLFEDPRSGASAAKTRYPAGFINTWHTHTTGHGMYVLDGVLHTSRGDYGPGEFVWFPEGEKMFHGATADNDVTFIFFTNKHFDIHYQGPDRPDG